ncbi:hypothetical protein CC1G_05106 [Coprinopsis cinerea okayama7|uniref:Uncharacterized protein n=1 Tax=Coprinopsis cinerea (strain Okayama-7 / 130 / ATCC MYA-4618 / FGSC 9003) TaxID=240176 RepID=A8NGC7_COPC7|nr:hypothetical protein CC1G_05106 [Coprinopsis cinerea okayama7\|eukprot:XP_001833406.1 hypothetical protein CC1G_05106 [Coprinopsis cinerea okayama7\
MSPVNDFGLIAAPRPVRLPAFTFARRVNASPSRADNDNNSDLASTSPSPLSGRSSTLPSEALEEFLAILKPSFFPSTSPTLGKSRRSLNIPTFHQYERPLAFKPRQRLENQPVLKSDVDDPSDSHPSAPTSPVPVGGEQQDSLIDHYDQEGPVHRWLRFGPLSSPVSRMHTRNPFLKQITEQPGVAARTLSPAAIPLPTPDPDEWLILQEA